MIFKWKCYWYRSFKTLKSISVKEETSHSQDRFLNKSFDAIMNNKHELFNENMIIISELSYMTNEHDSNSLNLQWNSYTRFMIYHHNLEFRNIINAFFIWFMLIFYNSDSENLQFHSRMIIIENYTHEFNQISSRK